MMARSARHITGMLDPVPPSRVTVALFFMFNRQPVSAPPTLE
jgi:hypothetical protein